MSGQMIPYFRCWLCWGVINPKGSVFNLDLYSLFLVNKELLSLTIRDGGSTALLTVYTAQTALDHKGHYAFTHYMAICIYELPSKMFDGVNWIHLRP